MTPSNSKRPTLNEIADVAHVSPTTVWRVVNSMPGVGEETRRRVHDVLRESGYWPTSKDLIGLIVPDASNPYFSNLGFCFQSELDKLGFHVVMASSDGRVDRELALVNKFKHLGLRGLVYIAGGEPGATVLHALADANIPVVVFDRQVQDGNLDLVAVDNRDGMQRAVDHLVAHGHEKIGHLEGLEGTPTARERSEGFVDALARNRLVVSEEWLWPGNYQFASGRTCAEMLIQTDPEDRPTAIVVANDAMAIGLIQRLQQAGWDLPTDLSVVGFDNIAIGEWIHPRLTTIEQPVDVMAYTAVGVLMDRIRHHETSPGEPLEPRLHVIQPRLIPRESTAPPLQFAALVSTDPTIVPLRRTPASVPTTG